MNTRRILGTGLLVVGSAAVGAHLTPTSSRAQDSPAESHAEESKPTLQFGLIRATNPRKRIMTGMARAKVPGGWLVTAESGDREERGIKAMTFVPDADHKWDGYSVP